jgi:CBS domain containing-hemolysin-like protein
MNPSLFIILPLCLAVSFLCAGMEAGIFSLNRWRIRHQMRAGKSRAAVLNHYLDHSENFLWTVLVGNTLAAFSGLALIALAFLPHLRGHSILYGGMFALAVFLFYVFCDLLPKMLFRQFPNRLTLLSAKPFRILHFILSPLVKLVEGFAGLLLRWTGGKTYTGHVFTNRQDLRLFMRDTAQELTSEEKAMINRVLDLQSFTIRQLVLARRETHGIEASAKLRDAMEVFRNHPYNAIPVWTGTGPSRRVAGVLNVKAILFSETLDMEAPVTQYLSSALFLQESMDVERALNRMQKAGQRLAVVLGRNRQELGVITLESVLRFMFGEVKL